jgi:hypothetical protein
MELELYTEDGTPIGNVIDYAVEVSYKIPTPTIEIKFDRSLYYNGQALGISLSDNAMKQMFVNTATAKV